MNINSLVVLFLSFGVATANAGSPIRKKFCERLRREKPESIEAVVMGNPDGDTLSVSAVGASSLSVRMLTIDTLESNFNGRSQGIWAERAKHELSRIAPIGSRVTLTFEGEYCDRYDRLLAHAFVGDLNLNQNMVEKGFAVNYCIYPNDTYCAEYGALADQNLEEERGIFSDDRNELPYLWRLQVSGGTFTKWIGKLSTKEVFAPSLDRVRDIPVGDRIFFFSREDIQGPYYVAEEVLDTMLKVLQFSKF